jgi:hypothetical protein
MAIHSISRPPAPEPKATCPTCHRPVALLKSGKCIYCGAPLPGALHLVEPWRGLPPDVLLSLQPRTAEVSIRTRWIRRMIAFGVSSLLVSGIVGPCMKS